MPVPSRVARAVDAALEGTIVLSFSRIGSSVRSRLEGWDPVTDLAGSGRRALVTGANSGLGAATTRALLTTGAEVEVLVRGPAAAAATRRAVTPLIGADRAGTMTVAEADLTDLAAVRTAADRLSDEDAPLDTLVHNAGAMFPDHALTVDGLERTYQVHVVAPFLVTARLLPRLLASDRPRLLWVTSGGMYTQRLDVDAVGRAQDHRATVAYARAKRAQVVLAREFARRLGARGLDVFAVHPGWAATPGVASSLPRFDTLLGPILRTPDEGADTIVWLALAPGVPGDGRLWHDRRPRSAHRLPVTREAPGEADRLWHRVAADAGLDPVMLTAS